MHIAGIAGIPDRGDSNLCLVQALLVETGGVEHGLRRSLGFGLGNGGRDLVQPGVAILGGSVGGGRREPSTVDISH